MPPSPGRWSRRSSTSKTPTRPSRWPRRAGSAAGDHLPADRDLAGGGPRPRPAGADPALGGASSPAEELAAAIVPGTILLPGERSLRWPRCGPCSAGMRAPSTTRGIGPKPPEEECLHDGGDRGLPAGIGPDGRLRGLDPEDTVAEYTDSAGRRRLTPLQPRLPVRAALRRAAHRAAPGPLRRRRRASTMPAKRLGQDLLRRACRLCRMATTTSSSAGQGPRAPRAELDGARPDGKSAGSRCCKARPRPRSVRLSRHDQAARAERGAAPASQAQVELVRCSTSGRACANVDQMEGTAVVARTEGGAEVIRGHGRDARHHGLLQRGTAPAGPAAACCSSGPTARRPQVGDVVTFSLSTATSAAGR